MKNSKNAILRYGFQIMILIAAGFLTGGGCKDAAPVDCGALSVSDCPADKCATYTNRLTKVQFCEKKIDATGTECADLSDKICDAENVITGKECGYLPKTVGSPDKECFELQDNCLVIGNKEALCKAAGIIKAGQNCEWDTTAGACKNPAIDFCNEVRDINDCNATLVAGRAPNGCYRKTNVGAPDECTERHADCTGLTAIQAANPAVVAMAVVNAPHGCYVDARIIGAPVAKNIVSRCEELPRVDLANANIAIVASAASRNCYEPAAVGTMAATKPATCAGLVDTNDCASANSTQTGGCYLPRAPGSVCTSRPLDCTLADADCNSTNTRLPGGCYPLMGGGCEDKPNSCNGLDKADCNEDNTIDGAPCYEPFVGGCDTKPDTCEELARADCSDINTTAAEPCYQPDGGDCATKPASCVAIDAQSDCMSANVHPSPAAGCLWERSHGQVAPKCYEMVILDPGQGIGEKCSTIGADRERCLVPGIEAKHGNPGVRGDGCIWFNGACEHP